VDVRLHCGIVYVVVVVVVVVVRIRPVLDYDLFSDSQSMVREDHGSGADKAPSSSHHSLLRFNNATCRV